MKYLLIPFLLLSASIFGVQDITINGPGPTMGITTATAGSQPDSDTDQSQTYTVDLTGEAGTFKITGLVDALTSGVTISANVTAPQGSGGTSLGSQSLTTGPTDLVTGINIGNYGPAQITYTLEATVAAGIISNDYFIVQYNLVQE